MKIICADRVPVSLYYDVNLKWHMPIYAEICRAKQKYMPFFGTVTERAFRKKKSKAPEHIQMMQRCALDFFPRNALGDGPAFWIFPGFTDKG